jgi:hypothetical protein
VYTRTFGGEGKKMAVEEEKKREKQYTHRPSMRCMSCRRLRVRQSAVQ